MTTFNEMAKFSEELAAKYPQAGITFGYLGNVDNRQYYIFTQIAEQVKIFVGDASGFLTQQVNCFADGRSFDSKPTEVERANKVVRTIEFRDIEARLVWYLGKVAA